MRLVLTVNVPDENADNVTDRLSQIGDRLAFDLQEAEIPAEMALSDDFETVMDW